MNGAGGSGTGPRAGQGASSVLSAGLAGHGYADGGLGGGGGGGYGGGGGGGFSGGGGGIQGAYGGGGGSYLAAGFGALVLKNGVNSGYGALTITSGASVTAPELSTWGLTALGFGAVGFMGLRRGKLTKALG